MGARARLFLLFVLAIAAAMFGMRASKNLPTEEDVVVALTAVPAPPGLVAEATLPTPDATWRKAQLAVGGVFMLAPPTFGGILAAYARVSDLAPLVDGAAGAYGVLDDRGRWVVATRAVSASIVRSTLRGDTDAKSERSGDIELFQVKSARCVGLVSRFLLVGSDCDAIIALGPYAYRTLPTREPPRSAVLVSIAHAALEGPVRAELERRRADLRAFLLDKDDEQRRAHGGRAPDLADPTALVSVADGVATRYIELIAGMNSVDVGGDVDNDALVVRATLKPPAAGPSKLWVDSLEGASIAPLSASSASAVVTVFWRSEEDERMSFAKDASSMLARALGTRVPTEDVTKLGELMARSAHARGPWTLASIVASGSPAGILRLASTDGSALTSLIEGAVDIVRRPSWASWEKDALSVTRIERIGTRATLDTGGTTIEAAWSTREGEVDFGVGLDAAGVLATEHGRSAVTLGSDPKASEWLRATPEAALAIVARPLLVNRVPRSDPAMLSLLKKSNTCEVRVQVPGIVVRQLVVSGVK